jgi:hypothetical protein
MWAKKKRYKRSSGCSNRGMVFTVWPVRTCYEQGSWNSELVILQTPASKNVSMEIENIGGIHHPATTGEDRRLRISSTYCSELQEYLNW